MDLGSDPGGGGGVGSGVPPATNMGAVVGAAGFGTGWAMGAGAFTTLACTGGATACVAGGTSANGWLWVEEAKSMEEGESLTGLEPL